LKIKNIWTKKKNTTYEELCINFSSLLSKQNMFYQHF